MSITIVIGNKNYSSWSLRPWLALKRCKTPFQEIRIPLDTPTTKHEILRYSPSGKVPALQDGDLWLWESLAICEHLAERFPEVGLWPAEPKARAKARSISAEMHAGFATLRQNMPMNIRASKPGEGRAPGVQQDIDRICEIWRGCRSEYNTAGPLLFGRFTIADAMFAPVVTRFHTYKVPLDATCQAYADAVWELEEMQEWVDAARNEKEHLR